MTNQHQYTLEKGSKKHLCPRCSKKSLVRFIDTETGDYLPDQYGRCDRESKCAYFLNPYNDGFVKTEREQERVSTPRNWKPTIPKIKTKPKPVFIPKTELHQTMKGYDINGFIQNLFKRVHYPFDAEQLNKIIALYCLGTITSGYMAGAVTFPFIDIQDNIRAIQAKQFDKYNHTTNTNFLHSIIKRDHEKQNQPLPDWLSKYLKNETKVSCLFGEHLLSMCPENPIALVESPKTALYATLYFGSPINPENYIWLAAYNISSLNYEKCKVLEGRNVFLFPDLGAYEKWSKKADEFNKQIPGAEFGVSDLLENNASEQDISEGLDLADYLIKLDWTKFYPRMTLSPQNSSQT